MKIPQAILGMIVAALALAAFVTFYDGAKPDAQSALRANEAAESTGLFTPARSIAHGFAAFPEFAHRVSTTSIAEDFAEMPKSVHAVPVRSDTPPAKQAIAVAPALAAPRDPNAVASAILPSHTEPDVCARSGGHRVNFVRGHHGMWRCVYPRSR